MMSGNFFIWCSGANSSILKECPTERTKYIGIGATILTTSALALLSGGYALYFTFDNFPIAVLFGLFWGILIFNLDRYIVSSMRKEGSVKKQLYMALPRFLIAIVLAVTISKPLELKLFNGTITKQLGSKEDAYNKNCETEFNNRRNELTDKKTALTNTFNETKKALYEKDPIFKDINTQKQLKQAENGQFKLQVTENAEIIQKNSWLEPSYFRGREIKIRRYNAVAQDRISENRTLKNRIVENDSLLRKNEDSLTARKGQLSEQIKAIEIQYANQINGVQKQIEDHEQQRESKLEKCRKDAAIDKDILSRLNALGELKKTGNTVWWASLLITILFILIETAPIVSKLMSNRGPYDDILARKEYEIFIEQQKIISKQNNDTNIFLETILETGKKTKEESLKIEDQKLKLEAKANEDFLKSIAEKQTDIASKIIDEWYNQQLDSFQQMKRR